MQIPKEAIEMAIKGGWRQFAPSDDVIRVDLDNNSWPMIWGTAMSGLSKGIPLAVAALDPSFWQALGKALGLGKETYHTKTGEEWGERFCNHCGISTDIQPPRSTGCNHVHHPEACDVCRKNTDTWEKVAHRFYDIILLNDGNGTKAFWDDLLK